MQRIALISLSLLLFLSVKGQDVPTIIPPSPEATSIVQYGNNSVNFYTGRSSTNIPIHSLRTNGIDLAVNLNYSGSGGVNVESVASWVGLGWSLNSGGVISRTVRGKPDETYGVGYLALPETPNPTSATLADEYDKIANGIHDGEPDQFHFNVNGLSGSFSLDRNANAIQKVKSNLKITHLISGNEFVEFVITDTNGNRYIFAEKEQTKSKSWGASNYSDYFTSSWFLTSIENSFGKVLFSFEYYNSWPDLEYTTVSALNVQTSGVAWGESQLKYTTNKIKSRRIKSINSDNGSIHFLASSGTRQDYLNDRYLDKIQIKDANNQIVKVFKFNYSYFDNNSISSIGVSASGVLFKGVNVGDYYKRLKLDQVQEWNSNETESISPYIFSYDESQYLPSRYSFALDHWGYFNGQNTNTFYEPKYKMKWFFVSDINYDVFGSANREPDFTYGKAGILTKITYPTGGNTSYIYEQNQVVDDNLPNSLSEVSNNYLVNGIWNSFTIDLINEPFSIVKLWGSNDRECDMRYQIRQGTNTILDATVPWNGQTLPSNKIETELEDGSYEIRLTIGSCALSGIPNTNFQLTKEQETPVTNKDAGGLRIKSITDNDGLGQLGSVVTRNFYYNEDSENSGSPSTGRLVTTPKYGFIITSTTASGSSSTTVSTGKARTVNSTLPLLKTNGSEVGYGKVTVKVSSGSETGKTEYNFTTAEDYPDFIDGFYNNALSGEGYITGVINVGTLETYPFAPRDSRDLWRGLLVEQVDYKYTNSSYKKVRSIKNTYSATFNGPYNNGDNTTPSRDPYSVASNGTNYDFVTGIVFHPLVSSYFKRYRIYSNRVDLKKTEVIDFDPNDDTKSLSKQTEYFYSDLTNGYFQVSRAEVNNSEGSIYKTENYYIYNQSASSVKTGMLDENIIAPIIEERLYKASTLLSVNRTEFNSSSSSFAPSEIKTAKGTASLDSRIKYNLYDAVGNLLEMEKTNGSKTVYLWGYNNTLPVAKIENATWADVNGVVIQTVLDSPTSDAVLRTELDKLRTHNNLNHALITTMTYQPGVGMTSQTTPNGLTTYYEYDSFGRLKYIKDKDGNILKKNEYAYDVNTNNTNNY